MSASIDTIRTRKSTDQTDQTEQAAPTEARDAPRHKKLDVSETAPERVAAYARETAAEGRRLYFERKGGRTYLVAR